MLKTIMKKTIVSFTIASAFAQAKHAKVPIIAFDVVHERTTQENGMTMRDQLFNALLRRLELVVGALVLPLHNMAVEHGLMNGHQGR